MGNVLILPGTTREPITKMGEMAGVCWGAETGDASKNYRRGLDCIESGHGRVMEFVNVEMVLDGYSARVIREYMRHVGGGLTVLQASTRYIDYGDFKYVTPPSIANDEIMAQAYKRAFEYIQRCIQIFEASGIPREDAAMLLPLGMTTRLVDHKNLRTLVDMSRQRLCNRAYWEFQELFRDISLALADYSEEWARIVNTQFMPKCDALGYCPERHGCGRRPGRKK